MKQCQETEAFDKMAELNQAWQGQCEMGVHLKREVVRREVFQLRTVTE